FLMHMCEKLASRLRRYHLRAKHFYIGVRSRDFGWIGSAGQTIYSTQDGREIFRLGEAILLQHWRGEPVWQIQVTALDPDGNGTQLDLLHQPDIKREQLNETIDDINERYGAFTIM